MWRRQVLWRSGSLGGGKNVPGGSDREDMRVLRQAWCFFACWRAWGAREELNKRAAGSFGFAALPFL